MKNIISAVRSFHHYAESPFVNASVLYAGFS